MIQNVTSLSAWIRSGFIVFLGELPLYWEEAVGSRGGHHLTCAGGRVWILQMCVRLSASTVELAIFWWLCGFIHSEIEWQDWLGTSDTVRWKMTCNRLLLRKNSLSPAVCLWALQSYRWEYKTERSIESNRLRLIDWQREVKTPGLRSWTEKAPERRCQLEGVREITSPLKGKKDDRSFLDLFHHAHRVPEGWIHKVSLNRLSGMKFKNDFPKTLDGSPLRTPCLKTNLKSAHLILFQTWKILLTVKVYGTELLGFSSSWYRHKKWFLGLLTS